MTGRPLRADIQPGRRYGTRVIVRHVPRAEALADGRRSGYWLLRCDCGKESRLQANQIGMSNRQSCGCVSDHTIKNPARRISGKSLDVTGMRFGILTAKTRVGSSKQGAIWQFRCDCGAVTEARLKDVRHGTTSSCGCLRARTGENRKRLLDINRPWRAADNVDDRWLVIIGERSPVGAGATATASDAPPA